MGTDDTRLRTQEPHLNSDYCPMSRPCNSLTKARLLQLALMQSSRVSNVSNRSVRRSNCLSLPVHSWCVRRNLFMGRTSLCHGMTFLWRWMPTEMVASDTLSSFEAC